MSATRCPSSGGNSFVTTCNSANDTGVDRPWLAAYGNPLSDGRVYMTVDETEQCYLDHCGLGQVGSNLLELTQASGADAVTQHFSPLPGQQIEPDGIVGGAVVDQSNGDLYLVHTAFTDASGKIVGGGDSNENETRSSSIASPAATSSRSPRRFLPVRSPFCKPYNSSLWPGRARARTSWSRRSTPVATAR